MARSLSNQVGILTAGRLVAYVAMFFVPLVNVRMLSENDLGMYRQFWLLYETVAGVLVMAFPNSLLYFFPRSQDRDEKSIYVAQTLIFLFGAGLASVGVYGILDVVLGGGLGVIVHDHFLAIALFTFFMIMSQIMDRLLVADRQVERQSLYFMASSIALATTVISVSITTRSVPAMINGLVAFSFATFVFTTTYTIRVYRPPFRKVTWATFKSQLTYALPLGFYAIVLTLFAKTDRYLITHYLGREMFAVYTTGAFQVPIVDIVRSSIWNVTFPMMAEYQQEGNYAGILGLWQRATLKTAVLFFPLFVFLELSARPFIEVLFTPTYSAATPVFMIYLFLFLISTIETGGLLSVHRRNDLLFKISVGAFIANVGLSIGLYHAIGWLGIPTATVLVEITATLLKVWLGGRLLGISLPQLMPWRGIAARFGVALVPGVALYFLYQWRPVGDFIGLALAGAGYFSLYFLIAFKVGFISMGEVRSIFRGSAK